MPLSLRAIRVFSSEASFGPDRPVLPDMTRP
jgi:hypothetical protein